VALRPTSANTQLSVDKVLCDQQGRKGACWSSQRVLYGKGDFLRKGFKVCDLPFFFNRKGFRVCDLFTNLCIETHFAVLSGRLFRDLLTTIIQNSKKSVSNHFIIEIDITKI
jgi:hypothetical protein